MQIFECDCGAPIFFDNVRCLGCSRELGFLPERQVLSALDAGKSSGEWKVLAAEGAIRRKCENYARENVCNWLVPLEDATPFCVACRLNETIPNLSDPNNRSHWAKLEASKRRLVYSILRLGLPLKSRAEDAKGGLAFAFLAQADPSSPRVLTGHAGGLITINVAEADDVEREQIRMQMHESYRTLLGHFRHESGHYYFNRLIADTPWHPRFRRLFGDESADYQRALARHYESGAPADWQDRHISVYASAHPVEDWAETWAHYLHIVDTIETSRAFGVARSEREDHLTPPQLFARDDGAATPPGFMQLLRDWVWLTLAANAINRSMGMRDINPFVLNAKVAEKLGFVHELVTAASAAPSRRPGE
jgi:hypothetical protein